MERFTEYRAGAPVDNRIEENNVRNENDKKKQFLRGYRRHVKRIKRIESEINEIRSMKMYPSVNNDGMPHGSNQGDLSGYAAELQQKEIELYEEGIERVQTYNKIAHRIQLLESEDERDVFCYVTSFLVVAIGGHLWSWQDCIKDKRHEWYGAGSIPARVFVQAGKGRANAKTGINMLIVADIA